MAAAMDVAAVAVVESVVVMQHDLTYGGLQLVSAARPTVDNRRVTLVLKLDKF